MFADGKMVTAKSDISAVTMRCRFLRMVFLPLFSGVVSLIPGVREIIAEYLIRTVIQLLGAKKEAGT